MDVSNMPKVVPLEEREWFVLFSICVAGKSAKQTQEKLNGLLKDMAEGTPVHLRPSAFDVVWWADRQGKLGDYLRKHKIGQYTRIEKAFREVVKHDVVTIRPTVEILETVPGIGPKTARFIVLYTNPDADCVPLDTHILKFLAHVFPHEKVPKSTPPAGHKYRYLEELFQRTAKAIGKTVRQLDTEVWQSYAKQ